MERLVFNAAEHKLEELEKYGFVKNLRKQRYERTFYGYLGLVETTHIDINTNEIIVIKRSIMGIDYIRTSFEIEHFTENEDLIKDGLVVKEKKDESKN